jgi:predicted amidohydrolase
MNLHELRHSIIKIKGKKVLLLPEFELTDYPTKHPLSVKKASQIVGQFDANIKIAGFVEKNLSRLYSTCIVVDGTNVHVVRKYIPSKTERDVLDPSFERPSFMNLSIGKTIILLCSDTKIFANDDLFISQCLDNKARNVFLVSAWLKNFDKAIKLMTNLAKELNLRQCYIMDRFHGLKQIK